MHTHPCTCLQTSGQPVSATRRGGARRAERAAAKRSGASANTGSSGSLLDNKNNMFKIFADSGGDGVHL